MNAVAGQRYAPTRSGFSLTRRRPRTITRPSTSFPRTGCRAPVVHLEQGKETPMSRAALRRRLRSVGQPACLERLERRRLLSFEASFPGGATLAQRADVNASRLLGVQMEGNVYINPTNPLNVVAFAIDLSQIN